LFLVWGWIFVAGCCSVFAGIEVLLCGCCQNQGVVTALLPNLGCFYLDIAEKGFFCRSIWVLGDDGI
jgi:hypothetical protein